MNMSADTPRENLTLTEADPCRLPSHRWRRRPRAQALCLFHGSERQWSLHVQVHSGRFVCLSAAEQARATTLPPETHASLTYLLIIPLILRDNLSRAIDRVYCHPQRLCLWCVTRSALVLCWFPGT